MSRRWFYIPPEGIRDGIAVLTPDQAHHLRDVLRLKPGDGVELFDGEGAGYAGVVSFSGDRICIASLEQLAPSKEPEPRLVLAPALLKAEKFDWILQKATELGVEEILPLTTRYSDVRLEPARLTARMERWQRIVREASKQCRRRTVPKVRRPAGFGEFLANPIPGVMARILFHEQAVRRWDATVTISGSALVCIGPEGGRHPDEVEASSRAGFQAFSLGPRILRAETAALAAVVLVQYQIANCGVNLRSGI